MKYLQMMGKIADELGMSYEDKVKFCVKVNAITHHIRMGDNKTADILGKELCDRFPQVKFQPLMELLRSEVPSLSCQHVRDSSKPTIEAYNNFLNSSRADGAKNTGNDAGNPQPLLLTYK